MKKILLFFCVVLSNLQSFAQPDAIYSQYMYNQFILNPAYAGSRDAMSALAMYRTRWVGIQDSPSTSTISLQSKLYPSNMAWGANIVADRLGPASNNLIGVTGAYHLKLNTGKLAFGIRAGVYNRVLNGTKLDFRDATDPLFTGASISSTVASADFGLYYYTRQFYASFAVNHLGNRTFNFDAIPDATFNLRPLLTFGLGYAFELNENLVLKPSLLLKKSDGFDANVDVNVSLLLYKKFWLGISLRNQTTLNFLLDFNVTDFLRMGYSYDLFINSLNNASNGAHEVFIGFDFGSKDIKTVSPRYL